MCMPHQMPTYFIGVIQLVIWMTLGGFKFRPSTDGDGQATRQDRGRNRQAVKACTVRWNTPGARVVRQRELGQRVGDGKFTEPRVRRQLVAKTDPVVEGPERHYEPPAGRGDLGDRD